MWILAFLNYSLSTLFSVPMTLVWLWCLIAVWVYPLDSNLRASAPYVPAVKNILFLETNSPHILTPFPIPSSTTSPGLSLTPSLGMAHPHSTVAFLLLFLGFSFFSAAFTFTCLSCFVTCLLLLLQGPWGQEFLGVAMWFALTFDCCALVWKQHLSQSDPWTYTEHKAHGWV